MNATELKDALNALDDDAYQALMEGAGLVVEQDEGLSIGRPDQAFVMFELGDETFENAQALKASLLSRAEGLIDEYYQFNPLSKPFFNRQLMAYVQTYGPEAFVSMPGQSAQWVVFADGGELVCEDASSPRFDYGLHLRLDEKMPALAIKNKVKNWVQSGSAYEDYISVNVCRFSCME
ncbi:hypothetical protein [Thiomicrospira sp. WB1]|uniref:hypothetical protein n=1 Tax=Thiomicrospira sp. WB1 TaxID=1685380 RepID=UPI000748BF16|nr:hypothetical protein [Thiomicrospira sp. WB1]KUJ72700.1 hypothetical protein AVO41_02575 [Thiomicrospira sp. WB1]